MCCCLHREIEAYRALVVSTREREQHIQWLETRLKEHGLVDANQPSALSTPIPMLPSQTSPAGHHVMMQPHNFATTRYVTSLFGITHLNLQIKSVLKVVLIVQPQLQK